MVDLQKAFDTTGHDILIKKCEYYGLRGKFGNIIKSYLHDRKACTKIGNSYSEESQIKYGVPQGSVLGPLLFSIYINDVVNHMTSCEIVLFADDILLISIHEKKEIMESNLQTDFDILNNWFLVNDVFINDTKTTAIMLSSPHRICNPVNLFIHSEFCNNLNDCSQTCMPVQNVEEAKYLGFTVDKFWKHKLHIATLIKKLRQMMPIFYKIKNVLSDKNKLIFFDALVVSHLRYCIEIYGFGPKYLIDRLQKTLNKLVKVFFLKNGAYKSTTNLFKEFKILSVSKLRDYTVILNNYFKKEHKDKDCFKTEYLRPNTVRYNIPMIKTKYGLQCKNYYIPTLFNKLTPELSTLTSFQQVKREVRKWLLNN